MDMTPIYAAVAIRPERYRPSFKPRARAIKAYGGGYGGGCADGCDLDVRDGRCHPNGTAPYRYQQGRQYYHHDRHHYYYGD
jgi:hypothetical protein